MNAEVVSCADGKLSVKGGVTIDNVVETMTRGAALLNWEKRVIDLGGITEVDSSAVSMLLEWQREGNRRGGRICFTNIPPKLESLVRLYGVSDLIHLP